MSDSFFGVDRTPPTCKRCGRGHFSFLSCETAYIQAQVQQAMNEQLGHLQQAALLYVPEPVAKSLGPAFEAGMAIVVDPAPLPPEPERVADATADVLPYWVGTGRVD